MSDPAYRFSGIGRPVDPAYPTNRAVLVLVSLGFVAGALRGFRADGAWLVAGFLGINAALTLFLAWALTRELAPDDDPAAFVAAGLAGVAWSLLGTQSLLIPATLLVAVRLVSRTTGKAAEPTDAFLVLPLFGFAAWVASWTLGLAGAAALAIDATLPRAPGQAERRYHLGLAVVVLFVTAARLLAGTGGLQLPDGALLLSGIAVLAGGAGLVYPSPRSCGDVDGEPLVDARVRGALLLGVLATSAVTLDAGVPTTGLGVLWASLTAVVVGLPFVLARRRRTL